MQIDFKYIDVLENILTYGYDYEDPNRKGVFRKELEQVNIKHLVQEGYPIITARKTYFKGAVGELLLFLKGKNDIRDYHKYGITFWDSDLKRYEGNFSKYPIEKYKTWLENNKKLKVQNQKDYCFKHECQLDEKEFENVFSTKTSQKYIIIDTFRKYEKNYKVCKIKFLNGGFEKEVMCTEKELYNAKNPYEITFLNTACLGDYKRFKLTKKELRQIKSVWNGMMSRCYEKQNKSYVRYGGRGVVVCSRWKCFEYFVEDYMKYENFKNSFKEPYHLDKDFKGNGFLYSYETCDLIKRSENISGIKEVVFEFENIDTGEIVFTDNIWKFLKDKKLGKSAESSFYDLVSGKLKTCKRWKCNSFSPKKYDMGKIYPYQYQKQLDVFDKFKENPLRTDLIINSWQIEDLDEMCLIPCHHSFQILGATDGFIINWSQRSTDFLLGSPINIQFYFLLGMLLQLWSGHKFNGIIGNLNKVHLYDNQFKIADNMIKLSTDLYKDDVEVELEFDDKLIELPFKEFIKHIEPYHFKIKNYDFVLDEKAPMLTYKK